eukprot:COSAG01_NODE_5953_length_3931_cov_21.491141_4_plen_234_part_00
MMITAAAALSSMAAATPAAPVPPAQLVLCAAGSTGLSKWTTLPTADGAPAPLHYANGMCATIVKGAALPCDPRGLGCLGLGACNTAPKFKLVAAAGQSHNLQTTIGGKVVCVDAMDKGSRVQLYECVHSANQGWAVAGGMVSETFDSQHAVVALSTDKGCKHYGPPPPAPPAPPSPFCPQYHPIHANNVYDPSGPLLDEAGTWHTWEDAGAWSHWWSKDLIHCKCEQTLKCVN